MACEATAGARALPKLLAPMAPTPTMVNTTTQLRIQLCSPSLMSTKGRGCASRLSHVTGTQATNVVLSLHVVLPLGLYPSLHVGAQQVPAVTFSPKVQLSPDQLRTLPPSDGIRHWLVTSEKVLAESASASSAGRAIPRAIARGRGRAGARG